MSKKVLIIDGQIFQTPAWHRGMGKYSMELIASLQKIKKEEGWDEISLILSSAIKDEEGAVPEIKSKLAGVKINYLELLPKKYGDRVVVAHNRKVVDSYIENYKDAEVNFLILSLMQSEIYPVFPSEINVSKLLLF